MQKPGRREQNQASYFSTFGYGNPAYDNSSCMIPTAETFATDTSATCVADNRRLVDAKIGFWKDLYKGPYGRFALGAELEIPQTYVLQRHRRRCVDRQHCRLYLAQVLLLDQLYGLRAIVLLDGVLTLRGRAAGKGIVRYAW
jgi:hypothetical protein